MKNKHTQNAIYDELLLELATTTFVPITKPAVNNSDSETSQDMKESKSSGQVKSEGRERVYLHSISRFSKLKKLQKSSRND